MEANKNAAIASSAGFALAKDTSNLILGLVTSPKHQANHQPPQLARING